MGPAETKVSWTGPAETKVSWAGPAGVLESTCEESALEGTGEELALEGTGEEWAQGGAGEERVLGLGSNTSPHMPPTSSAGSKERGVEESNQ